MSRPFTRKGVPLVVLGAFGLFLYAMLAGCSVRSEQPVPPQQPAQTFVNNMPPAPPSDNSGFLVLITVLIIGAVIGAYMLARNQGRAESATDRAARAENALAKVLERHPNALTNLNGQYVYPDMHPSVAMRMPVTHPQMPMLERGQQ